MTKTIAISLILFFISACGNGKDTITDAENTSDIDQPIETVNAQEDAALTENPSDKIDAKVQLIENKISGSSAISSTLENEDFMECQTDGGCSLTAHYFNDEILKVTSWYGFSNGYQEVHYYIENGQLIKANELRFEWHYNVETDEFDYGKTNKNFDGNYYFEYEKLIFETSTGHNRFENDEINAEDVLLQEAKDYINKFNN